MLATRLREQKLRNVVQSLLLLAAMAGLMALLGWTLAGNSGLLWFLVFAPILLGLGQSVSPHWIMRSFGARPVPAGEAPVLYSIMRSLAERAGLPRVPQLYFVPSRGLTAFSVGQREDAAVAVSGGLVRVLTPRELTGVLAHELSHVRHGDVRVMALADLLARMTLALSQVGQILLLIMVPFALLGAATLPLLPILVLIGAPLITTLLQLGLSRTREYSADMGAVELTGDAYALASALEKLHRHQRSWLQRMLPGGEPQSALFHTHPPTPERIRRLLKLGEEDERSHELHRWRR